MATIKEVAQLAGVSTSTVSRALSKKVRVDDATVKRVMAAVKKLGYKPNPMAKGLKEGYSRTLALVLPDITNPFFPKLVKCFERCAMKRGYSLILCDSGNDADVELRHLEEMESHFVDGILYLSVADGTERARGLKRAGIPLVLVNRGFDAGVPCVTNDNFAGSRAIVEYLIKNGHRKIACLVPDTRAQHYRQRLDGCVCAFQERGIENYQRYLVQDVGGVEDAYRNTRAMLAKKEPPTAFFAFVDAMAMGIYSGVHACGLSVPKDISVAGFDNINLAQHMIPPLTTYDHPVDRIAETAMEKLIRQINGDSAGKDETVEIAGSLIVRESVRKR